MKSFKRALTWLLTVCMVLSIVVINNVVAKADGTVWLEFKNNSVSKVSDNAVQYTVDENVWKVTITGLDSLQWKDRTTEIENIPVGTTLTFTLFGDKLTDTEVPKPKLNIAGESMNFSSDNGYAIMKTFDTPGPGGPIMVELTSGSSDSGATPTPTPDPTKTIEFRGAAFVEGGQAGYKLGDGEDAPRVMVSVSVDGAPKNISDGEHKEIQVEESKVGTVRFTLANFDAASMQAIIRGDGGYQQVLAVSDGSASLSGLTLPGGMVNFSVEPKSSGGPGGEGDGGGAHGPQVDCNMTINWSGTFGEIKVGDIGLSDVQGKTSGSQTLTRVTVDESNNVKIKLQADFTRVFSSIKIDGSEKVTGDMPEVYEFTVSKDVTSVSIEAVDAASDYFTIVWSYNPDDFGPDAYVQNGQVEVLSGYTDGNPGHYRVKKGDTVRVKLIPSYGYQVVGAKINGDVDLTACDGTNEFEFEMPSTNVHFQGIFTKTEDIVNCNASAVASASLGNGSAVAGDGGSAKMTVSSGTAADTSNVTSGSVDTSKSVQAVNITMEQVFYKNTADSVWSTPKSELSREAEVRLQVNQQADGYAVLREHEGQITQIPASYDPATQTLIFASSQYSNYTLVPLVDENNNYVPKEEEKQVQLVSSENTQAEQIKKLEQQETEMEIQTVVVDTTGVTAETEQLVPQETFNLSEIKTVKGFVSAMQKVLEKSEKLAYVTATTTEPKPVSIYTEKPVCFNKTVAAAFTNAKMDIVYYFTYQGHLFSVTIPAGTDLKAIFDKVPYAGPLYIGYVLGTSQIIE